MASNKDLYKEFDVKLVTKWECPEGGGAPIITMPNIPKPLHHCLRGDAEVLTTDGWKRIDSVTTDDVVATWDKDTEKIIWDHPYETIKKFAKQMVRIRFEKYKTFGLLVTPEHRIPIRKQTDGRKQINGVRKLVGREWVLTDKPAAKINLNSFQHFITAARNGTDNTDELTDLERVYISIQADGCLRYEKNGERFYRMTFRKDRKKKRFEELCDGAGVYMTKIKHDVDGCSATVGEQRYHVKVEPDCKNFWNCFDITSFGKAKAQQFIDEISLWDGSCAETCGILNRRYVTTNLDNAKFAQAVAVIAGVTSSFQVDKVKGKRTKDCYIIDFLDRDYRATQSCVKEVEEFDDYAYCINVPTSYFIVRDADTQSVMITGNCNPRNLLGVTTWNHMRRRCYAMADMTCEICGKKQEKGHCDAHELYDIDYTAGTSRFVRTICLCRLCHRYGIHTGRCVTLHKAGNPLMHKDALLDGAENAFSLVSEWNKNHPNEEPLRLYANWLEYLRCEDLEQPMRELIDKHQVKFYMEDPKRVAKWNEWRLIIDTKEYPTPYANQKAWEEAMKEYGKNDTTRIYGARKKKFKSVDDVEITEHDLQKIEKAEIPEGF